jgi:hypothetical protein
LGCNNPRIEKRKEKKRNLFANGSLKKESIFTYLTRQFAQTAEKKQSHGKHSFPQKQSRRNTSELVLERERDD